MHHRTPWIIARCLVVVALGAGCGGTTAGETADAAADVADAPSGTDAAAMPDATGANDVAAPSDITDAAADVPVTTDAAGADVEGDGAGACEPVTSAGCSADHQCFFTTPGNPQCVNPGTLAVGAPCTSILACVKGALCINGKCNPICDASGSNKALGCAAPGYCGMLIDKSGVPLGGNLGVCFGGDNCDPVTNAGCTAGDACDPGGAATFCQKPGTVAIGGGCLGPTGTDCTADGLCIGASATAAGVCGQRCDTTATGPCPNGKTCGGVTSGGVKVGNNFGVCQ